MDLPITPVVAVRSKERITLGFPCKKCNSSGGDWNPGWERNPRYHLVFVVHLQDSIRSANDLLQLEFLQVTERWVTFDKENECALPMLPSKLMMTTTCEKKHDIFLEFLTE